MVLNNIEVMENINLHFEDFIICESFIYTQNSKRYVRLKPYPFLVLDYNQLILLKVNTRHIDRRSKKLQINNKFVIPNSITSRGVKKTRRDILLTKFKEEDLLEFKNEPEPKVKQGVTEEIIKVLGENENEEEIKIDNITISKEYTFLTPNFMQKPKNKEKIVIPPFVETDEYDDFEDLNEEDLDDEYSDDDGKGENINEVENSDDDDDDDNNNSSSSSSNFINDIDYINEDYDKVKKNDKFILVNGSNNNFEDIWLKNDKNE